MDLNNSDEILPLAFIHMYFHLDDNSIIPEVKDYVNNEKNYETIINYLSEIGLKFMVGEATPDTFKYIMPQFRFECNRDYQLEIVKFDFGNVYLKKGAVVFATNLMVTSPSETFDFLIKKMPELTDSSTFAIKSEVGNKFYMWNGTDGIVFARPYFDWMGMKVCNGTPYTNNTHYRMYIIGDILAKIFIDAKIEINTSVGNAVLKNYYKGTPLKRTENEKYVINYKKFTTNNYDVVFDSFEEEFRSKIGPIHFVQRDYIYDAKFPADLLEELQKNWVSDTSVYKIINNFTKNTTVPDLNKQFIIDRYSVNGYRKMMVVNDKYTLPVNKSSSVEYIFVTNDMLQLRHTLNAAFVPNLGIVILATHVFFGARRVLNFEPHQDLSTFVKRKVEIKEDNVFYHVGGSYFLEETFFNANDAPIFILVRVEDDLIVRHNLIRTSRKLKDLKYNWVFNTILSLFVRKY
nr:p49 [Pieris rapae granulovirus]